MLAFWFKYIINSKWLYIGFINALKTYTIPLTIPSNIKHFSIKIIIDNKYSWIMISSSITA